MPDSPDIIGWAERQYHQVTSAGDEVSRGGEAAKALEAQIPTSGEATVNIDGKTYVISRKLNP